MKDKIISILLTSNKDYISGQEIADILEISRNTVWKHIKSLIEEGFNIMVIKSKGYSLKDYNIVNKHVIKKYLTSNTFNEIEHYKSIDSTSTFLKNKTNSKEGMLIIADHQTNGRGRRGREFISPKNNGLYFSFLIKPNIELKDISFITMISVVSVVDSIKKETGVSVDIKWVNDILFNDKKLCGILTEATIEVENQEIENIVVGIGLNVGTSKEIIDNKEINAISLYEIIDKEINKNKLISSILNCFSYYYKNLILKRDYKKVIDLYKINLNIINKEVLVRGPNYLYEAKVIDISQSGKLIVKDHKGEVSELISEEISMKGKVINEN